MNSNSTTTVSTTPGPWTSEQIAEELAHLIADNADSLKLNLISWEFFQGKQRAFYATADRFGVTDKVGCLLSQFVRDPGREKELIEEAAK